MTRKHRVAIIGASCRAAYAFAEPLIKEYAETHEVVGWYDIVPRRMQVVNDFIHASIPAYQSLDEMFERARPDTVVVATIDATHAQYIEEALARGANCISEKPLCTDAEQCRRIRAAQAKRPDLLALTAHNYRYGAHMMKIKELVESGTLGTVRSIVFQEMLDKRHGSSYFRRWNRQKKNSGGLLVHKACHCYDLMNWVVGSRAKTLTARGSLTQYGPKASPFRGERCCVCEHAKHCPQYLDLSRDQFRGELYFRAREPGSYTPDLCVFSPEIDCEDHATLGYEYENGVQVTFDLCAYTAYEGMIIDIEGTEGRLEYTLSASTFASASEAKYGQEKPLVRTIRIFRFEKPPETVPVDSGEGGHGGADPMMMKDLFGAGTPSKARASLEDGIQAVLIGAAANVSIATGRSVDVQALAPMP